MNVAKKRQRRLSWAWYIGSMTKNLINPISTRRLVTAVVVLAVAGLAAGTAYAQSGNGTQSTPKSWNYEIKDGKRVPKAKRVTNADGSWREESKQGACTTVKQSSAKGEVTITRKCD